MSDGINYLYGAVIGAVVGLIIALILYVTDLGSSIWAWVVPILGGTFLGLAMVFGYNASDSE